MLKYRAVDNSSISHKCTALPTAGADVNSLYHAFVRPLWFESSDLRRTMCWKGREEVRASDESWLSR